MNSTAYGAPCHSRTQCRCTGLQPLLWCRLLRALPSANAWPLPPLPSGQCLLAPSQLPTTLFPFGPPPPSPTWACFPTCKLRHCHLFPQVYVCDVAASPLTPAPFLLPPPLFSTDWEAWLLPPLTSGPHLSCEPQYDC